MNNEILDALSQITREKSVDRALLIETLEAGLASAVRKKYGATADVEVKFSNDTGADHASRCARPWSRTSRIRRSSSRSRRRAPIKPMRAGRRRPDLPAADRRVRPQRHPDREAGADPARARGRARARVPRVLGQDRHAGARRRPAGRSRQRDRQARPLRRFPAGARADRPVATTARASTSARWSSTWTSRPRGRRSSCRAPIPTSCGGCSRPRCRRSPRASSRSRRWLVRPARAPRSRCTRPIPRVDAVGSCVGLKGSRVQSIVPGAGRRAHRHRAVVSGSDRVRLAGAVAGAGDGRPGQRAREAHERGGRRRPAVARDRQGRPERAARGAADRLEDRPDLEERGEEAPATSSARAASRSRSSSWARPPPRS